MRDTASDGRNNTEIEIGFTRVTLQFPEPYRRETVKNTSGCNTNESFSFNSYQPGSKVEIAVRECVIRDDAPDNCSTSKRLSAPTCEP